jgi:electron transport complex protein RnfG
MKQIIRITIGLTISCLIAALLMGVVFTITAKAKKHNEHVQVQETMLDLLGYNGANPAPPDLKLHNIYRYILKDGRKKYLGYMIPVKEAGSLGYKLLIITLEGKFHELIDLSISPEKAIEAQERETALNEALQPPVTFTYADETAVAVTEGKRLAYLVRGEFQGFKTFITIMLAFDPNFRILGMEVMEHEEDPGLGGEIEEDYFEDQFKNKTFEKIKKLDVVKKPLPEEYRKYLEPKLRRTLTGEDLAKIRKMYQDADIYALTGATISSKAVTDGVKNATKKFAYRIEVLDSVIAEHRVAAAF